MINLLKSGILIFSLQITSVKAETIPANYHKIAIEHDIPSAVIYGVALAESGKKFKTGSFKPWPWTLNFAGVPRRYPTRIAAYKGLMYYLKQGVKSIDIGFMQVNWRYHQKKLGTPWQALEPFHNIRTAARILKAEYQKTGIWKQAIGRYHSPGQKPKQKKRALHYANRVMKYMHRIRQQKV